MVFLKPESIVLAEISKEHSRRFEMDISDELPLVELERDVREFYSSSPSKRLSREEDNFDLVQQLDLLLGAKSAFRSEREFGIGDSTFYILHPDLGLVDVPDDFFSYNKSALEAKYGESLFDIALSLSDVGPYAALSLHRRSLIQPEYKELEEAELPEAGQEALKLIKSCLKKRNYYILTPSDLTLTYNWLKELLSIGEFQPSLRLMLYGGEDVIYDELNPRGLD